MSNKDISQLFVKSLQTQKLKKSIAKNENNGMELFTIVPESEQNSVLGLVIGLAAGVTEKMLKCQ